jgi:signal transduction histidine kinase
LLDVEREVRAALTDAAASASGWRTRFEFAVRPDLTTRTDVQRFRTALTAMVAHAAAQAPTGRVLVTATRHGGRIQVTVGDDGSGADRAVQAAALREVESLIAMQGGTLEIVAQPGEGTRLIARWPDALREPASATESSAIESSPPETKARDPDVARAPQNEFSH